MRTAAIALLASLIGFAFFKVRASTAAVILGVATTLLAVFGVLDFVRGNNSSDDTGARMGAADIIRRRIYKTYKTEAAEQKRLLENAREPARISLGAPTSHEFKSYTYRAQSVATCEWDNLLDTYMGLPKKRMLILGEAGSGKTVLLLELIRQASRKECGPALIRVNISEWRSTTRFSKFLSTKIAEQATISPGLALKMLERGDIIPLLDGLDELDPEHHAPGRGADIVAALNASSGYSDLPGGSFVLTCRTSYFKLIEAEQERRGDSIGLDNATMFVLNSLKSRQILDYLEKNLSDVAKKTRWSPILTVLSDRHPGDIAVLLSSPWHLALAFRIYRDRGDPKVLLDDPKNSTKRQLYPRFLASVMEQPPRTPDDPPNRAMNWSWTRPFGSRPEATLHWIKQLAIYLSTSREAGGGGGELRLYEIYRMVEKRIWRPIFIAGILLALTAICAAVIFIAADGNHSLIRMTFISLTLILVSGGGFVAIVKQPDAPAGATLRREIRSRQGTQDLIVSLLAALAVGAFTLGTRNTLEMRVLGGICCGFLAGLIFGFVHATILRRKNEELYYAEGPEDPLHGGLLDSSIMGALVALVYTSSLLAADAGFLDSLTFGACALIIFSPVMGLPITSMAWNRNKIAWVILVGQGRAPWLYNRFLRWGCRRGLIRTSGLAYQFRHEELQSWLAITPEDELFTMINEELASKELDVN
jgi:hypothetical protein